MASSWVERAAPARVLNVLLGIWLLISAFAWPHGTAARTNTWLVGLLVIAFSILATSLPALRWANTALSIWLFVSLWFLPYASIGTRYNDAAVAICVFFVSLAPTWREPRIPQRVQV